MLFIFCIFYYYYDINYSWGEEGWDYLQKVLNSHKNTENLKVKSYASGGTTTADWAKRPDKLLDDVNKNSDAQYIWLTLGGNDAGMFVFIFPL